MNFEITPEQEAIREAVAAICSRFTDEYWLARDRDGAFPEEFYAAIAAGGWLGICIPEEYGGSGLGITEAALMNQVVAARTTGSSLRAPPRTIARSDCAVRVTGLA